jgi:hypothetical protein
MSAITAHILGSGIATPHGTDIATVRALCESATPPPISEVTNPETGRRHFIATVPASYSAHLAREPRLRRASSISMLAATAAQSAIAASGITPGSGTALVLGVSNGCAQYTRRFYEQIVKTGANAASPLLFPETVHNAPASHLAAMLKLDGATYTVIGDGSIGLQAVHFASQLIAIGDAENVVVAAAEELDWILAEGHTLWRLTNRAGKCTPHRGGGALLAEGAAAVVLGSSGGFSKITSVAGISFPTRRRAGEALNDAVQQLGSQDYKIIVDGANGTWLDAEFSRHGEPARRLSPKATVGEAVGAAALQQVVIAAHFREPALVPALGWNQQASAAFVTSAT